MKKELVKIERVSKSKKERKIVKGKMNVGILNSQGHADGRRLFHVMIRAADQ